MRRLLGILPARCINSRVIIIWHPKLQDMAAEQLQCAHAPSLADNRRIGRTQIFSYEQY